MMLVRYDNVWKEFFFVYGLRIACLDQSLYNVHYKIKLPHQSLEFGTYTGRFQLIINSRKRHIL